MEESNNQIADKQKNQGLIDKLIDKVFSIHENTKYLLLIFLFGFLLRIVAAINLGVSADDMHFVTHAINFLSSNKLTVYDQSSGLWYLFTDLMYRLFGTTQLASRMAALLFGSFSIFLIYLLSKEFFNEKVSLIAAFLLAISPFSIKYTVAEMDLMAMFFVLFSMLFFVKALKSSKNYQYVLSGIFIGMAIYTKVYPLLFIPSMLFYFIYFKYTSKEKVLTKKHFKFIFLFLFFAFLFCIPALTHNYVLYSQKGFLDLQFTRSLGLGKNISEQYYGWDFQFNAKNSWSGLFFGDTNHVGSGQPLLLAAVLYVFRSDPVVFIFGILGLWFLINSKNKLHKDYFVFFLLSILFILPFLASIILLPKHYIFLELLLIPSASFFIFSILIKKIRVKNISKIILILILLTSLIYLGLSSTPTMKHFYGKSDIAQIMEFKQNKIPENSLIIGDSRFYRGRIHWSLNGRPYLEGVEFLNLLSKQDQLPGEVQSINVYFVECVMDDCGWGGINEQPELNQSMENLVSSFKNTGNLEKEIYSPSKSKNYFPFLFNENIEHSANIYSTQIQMKSSIVFLANQSKDWFLYPIGYPPEKPTFDAIYPDRSIDSFLISLSRFIISIALVLSVFSLIFVIYLITKND
jgi:4-amino-4-deoxy-L-arabinose transferase-like glycosyltransferase